MKDKNVYGIYFSPTGSTQKVVETVTKGISNNVLYHNITQGIKKEIKVNSKDIVVIGVPSYSGRVPSVARKYLSEIKTDGAYAILVCVYGNREYEDTLVELKQICFENGFKPISAGAFIARHSIFHEVAKGRPDNNDLKTAFQLGKQTLIYIGKDENLKLPLKGNYPYREIGSVPLTPKTNSKCKECGVCAYLCPVNAIDKNNPKKTDKKLCISCSRCIEKCPDNARQFKGVLYKIASNRFLKKNNRRKEIELFFPEPY